MKKTLPLLITFFMGTFMLSEYFIPWWRVEDLAKRFETWGIILGAAATLLGLLNILQVNLPKIFRLEKDWFYKAIMILSAIYMIVIGAIEGQNGRHFTYFYDYIFQPCNATMFALLAFFIASAAFRAFRARNFEAFLLLFSAIVVMLGRVPIGEYLSEHFPTIMDWIMNGPNIAGKRAILCGAALGIISMGLRVILGLERSHLGE